MYIYYTLFIHLLMDPEIVSMATIWGRWGGYVDLLMGEDCCLRWGTVDTTGWALRLGGSAGWALHLCGLLGGLPGQVGLLAVLGCKLRPLARL